MSTSKFCGLIPTTNTASATKKKPLRPRAVTLRKAVQKLADQLQAKPSSANANANVNKSHSPSSHQTAPNFSTKKAYNKTRHKRQSSSIDSLLEKEETRLQEEEEKGKSGDFEWARDDQLSVILEILESEAGTRKNTPNWAEIERASEYPFENEKIGEKEVLEVESEAIWIANGKGKSVARATATHADLRKSEKGIIDFARVKVSEEKDRERAYREVHTGREKEKLRQRRPSWDRKERRPSWGRVRFLQDRELRIIEEGERLLDIYEREEWERTGRMSAPDSPRPIQPPPRDLESISRIDSSLVFEHFTTDDAWLLGSALRSRLLPIATPVVINISLANQNQPLFHTCTHSGVMPDNDSWVARKRKTVLRWGCSTWYMHCKFGGDEVAFREKYGLGNSAGEYAIHGGGVPIRVTGVEGVVAVVVVSGMKQDEDHGVIVEVIRELYY